MASLNDIWDTPAETVTQASSSAIPISTSDDEEAAPSHRPGKRKQALFFDSDSEGEAVATSGKAHYASKPSSSKPDIDALFDDLDDPDTGFQELAPSLDVAALKRQADAKLASLTPHQILPSSSPPRDLGDDDDDEEKGGSKKDKSKKTGLGGKKRPKLDQGRLMGPDGFPALLQQAKDFKMKGKGHELSDLSRLLTVYQFWAHRMYPNMQFSDTVQRVEKLCHSKRMHVALGVWRDEDKGLINGHRVGSDDESDKSGSDKDDDGATRPTEVPVATEDERSSPSLGPSVPPSSASEAGFDDFDIDAMIREDEQSRAQASTNAAASLKTTSSGPAPVSNVDEDEAMWDALDDLPNEPFVPKPAPTPSMDEDEDMWDMMREMEMEAEAAAKASNPPPLPSSSTNDVSAQPAPGPGGLVGQDPTRKASNDEGWDEMYA